jgi:hypothetical protein
MILLGLAGGASIGLAGCATVQPSVGVCAIAVPEWPAARSDYDRASTLAVLGSLKRVVAADRSQLHAGQRDEVGARADELFRLAPSSSKTLVSHGALELALRLRQLDCAVERGIVAAADAEHRYDTILLEVDAERLVMGEAPAAVTAGVTPSRAAAIR